MRSLHIPVLSKTLTMPHWFAYRCVRFRLVSLLMLLWLMLLTGPVAKAQSSLSGVKAPAGSDASDTIESGSAVDLAASLPWPSRTASMVTQRPVLPWTVRWVGFDGLGTLQADIDDHDLLAEQLGCADDDLTYEGKGSVVVRMNEHLTWPTTTKLAGRPIGVYEYLSAAPNPNDTYTMQRTWCALYEPLETQAETDADNTDTTKSDSAPDSAGLIVLLPGMFGTPEPIIDSLVGMLRKHRFYVLRMLTHSSRFTESGIVLLNDADKLDDQARQLGHELGDRAAENAMAVDAICEQIAQDHPQVPVDHRIGMGISGGGMILATVIAHNPSSYAGAVFMGAGCNFARIGLESNYVDMIDAIRILVDDSIDASALDRWFEAYLEAAPLDSYHTAAILKAMKLPMLMIQGGKDKAVPVATGDKLWEQLGKPERWVGPVGHEALFMAYLPMKSLKLMDWLTTHCALNPTPQTPDMTHQNDDR